DFVDQTGAPTEAIPFTQQEAKYNAEHKGNNCQVEPCNAEFALWAGPIVPDFARDRVLLFYLKIHRIVAHPMWTNVGSGIAVADANGTVVRPIESPGSPDPTLLFSARTPMFIAGSVVVGDVLYSYGCSPGFLVQNCDLARVPVADALDRSAWRFYAGD